MMEDPYKEVAEKKAAGFNLVPDYWQKYCIYFSNTNGKPSHGIG